MNPSVVTSDHSLCMLWPFCSINKCVGHHNHLPADQNHFHHQRHEQGQPSEGTSIEFVGQLLEHPIAKQLMVQERLVELAKKVSYMGDW